MKKAYVAYRCCNCAHISRIIKRRKKRYQCPRCGTKETKIRSFMKWTWTDISFFINQLAQEPYDSELLRAARMIVEAEARGDVIKIQSKQGGRSKEIKTRETPIEESEPPAPHRPIIPEIKPRCWGEKWNYADKHCNNKCYARKSCKKEFEYREYKKGLLPDETSQ